MPAKRHGTGRRATVNGPDSLNPSAKARKVEVADRLVEAVEAAIEPVHPTSPEVTASSDAVTPEVKASAEKAVRELGFRPVYKAERFGGPDGFVNGYQLRDIVFRVKAWQSGRGYTVTTRSGNMFLTSSPELVEANGRPLIGAVIEALVFITVKVVDGVPQKTNNAEFIRIVRMPD